MLKTNIPPDQRGNGDQGWGDPFQWAIENGAWRTIRGCEVLQLGASDYVLAPDKAVNDLDPVLYSVNGDPSNEWDKRVPFGIRWAISKADVEHGRRNGSLDALAIEQFKLRGLI